MLSCVDFTTGPPNPENLPEDGKLKSEVMAKENRRYYLDLKENNRGRFLRVGTHLIDINLVNLLILNIHNEYVNRCLRQ